MFASTIALPAGNPDRPRRSRESWSRCNPTSILAYSTPVAAALRRESRTIPIVFVNVSDPVGSGFVASLARPGGNLTGFMLYEEGITGKWLAMLKEIAPQLARVALIANPRSTAPTTISCVPPRRQLRRSRSSWSPVPIENVADIERVIAVVRALRRMVVWSYCRTPRQRPASRSRSSRLRPGIACRRSIAFRFFVAAGGLMSYGTDSSRSSDEPPPMSIASCKGAKPADLPVQAPTKYETVINLKTAKALGLEVPPTLLVRADEVIE